MRITTNQLNKNWKAIIRATILENPFIPHKPFLNQIHFLTYESEELLYGGQAGGGKSDAILMSALQFAEMEGYQALIIRRTLEDLDMPNAIMDRAKQWLLPLEDEGLVHWKEQKKRFYFYSGATLTFRYLSHNKDLNSYQGAELQFVGFDELTQFPENQYTYLHSRLRKLEDVDLPLRMRAGTNPGGIGHEWVKKRFIQEDSPIPFIQSAYTDNKYLNIEQYGKQLDKLDELTRLQLKFGDWNAELTEGLLINRQQLNNALISKEDYKDWIPSFNVIGIDKASTGDDNFAIVSLTYFTNGKYVMTNIKTDNSSYPEEMVYDFVETEYQKYKTYLVDFEGEPGSDSLYALRHWQGVLDDLINKYGIIVKDTKAIHSKFNRARPIAREIKNGDFYFDKDLDLRNIFNQFIYIHPNKEIMKMHPSPDELDALGYAYAPLKEIVSSYVTIH